MGASGAKWRAKGKNPDPLAVLPSQVFFEPSPLPEGLKQAKKTS